MTKTTEIQLRAAMKNLQAGEPDLAISDLNAVLSTAQLTLDERKYTEKAIAEAELGTCPEAENIINLFLLP